MRKAASPTGVDGFTLIETLFAVLILSAGVIFIAPALFRSGGVMAHLSCRFEAQLLMNNLIVEQEESLRRDHQLDESGLRGTAQFNGVTYAYELKGEPQDEQKHLYFLTARVAWRDIKENSISKAINILQ